MELRTLTQDDTTVEIEVDGEDDTILNLVKQQLLQDDDVEVATYLRGHPRLDKPTLKVEVTSGDPVAKIEDAVSELRQEFDDLESAFLDATS